MQEKENNNANEETVVNVGLDFSEPVITETKVEETNEEKTISVYGNEIPITDEDINREMINEWENTDEWKKDKDFEPFLKEKETKEAFAKSFAKFQKQEDGPNIDGTEIYTMENKTPSTHTNGYNIDGSFRKQSENFYGDFETNRSIDGMALRKTKLSKKNKQLLPEPINVETKKVNKTRSKEKNEKFTANRSVVIRESGERINIPGIFLTEKIGFVVRVNLSGGVKKMADKLLGKVKRKFYNHEIEVISNFDKHDSVLVFKIIICENIEGYSYSNSSVLHRALSDMITSYINKLDLPKMDISRFSTMLKSGIEVDASEYCEQQPEDVEMMGLIFTSDKLVSYNGVNVNEMVISLYPNYRYINNKSNPSHFNSIKRYFQDKYGKMVNVKVLLPYQRNEEDDRLSTKNIINLCIRNGYSLTSFSVLRTKNSSDINVISSSKWVSIHYYDKKKKFVVGIGNTEESKSKTNTIGTLFELIEANKLQSVNKTFNSRLEYVDIDDNDELKKCYFEITNYFCNHINDINTLPHIMDYDNKDLNMKYKDIHVKVERKFNHSKNEKSRYISDVSSKNMSFNYFQDK